MNSELFSVDEFSSYFERLCHTYTWLNIAFSAFIGDTLIVQIERSFNQSELSDKGKERLALAGPNINSGMYPVNAAGQPNWRNAMTIIL